MLISDRDGVLFDTCRLNIESYLVAAEKFGLKTRLDLLSKNIHKGLPLNGFYGEVWGDLPQELLQRIRMEKNAVFARGYSSVRLNFDYVENFLRSDNSPFLVTRASIQSTTALLNHFKITFFENRVANVGSEQSKGSFFAEMARSYGFEAGLVTVVDDSLENIREADSLGFRTILYPHFCDY
jgi:hypothetical protein